jgi:hypothetical protein
MELIKIFADFQNADRLGRLRLNCAGTLEDLLSQQVELREGMQMILTDGEGIETEGTATYSDEEKIWTAKIDWGRLTGR